MSMDKIRFYADVTKTELPFIRIEEGAFEGMILLVDTGSNDNILFGHFYNQAKEKFQPMEGSRDTYGIEGTIRQRNMVSGIVSFCGTEYEMQFTVQENDDCAIMLSKEMGFPVFGILGTNFMAEHGWIIDFGKQEITISLPISALVFKRLAEAKQRAS